MLDKKKALIKYDKIKYHTNVTIPYQMNTRTQTANDFYILEMLFER